MTCGKGLTRGWPAWFSSPVAAVAPRNATLGSRMASSANTSSARARRCQDAPPPLRGAGGLDTGSARAPDRQLSDDAEPHAARRRHGHPATTPDPARSADSENPTTETRSPAHDLSRIRSWGTANQDPTAKNHHECHRRRSTRISTDTTLAPGSTTPAPNTRPSRRAGARTVGHMMEIEREGHRTRASRDEQIRAGGEGDPGREQRERPGARTGTRMSGPEPDPGPLGVISQPTQCATLGLARGCCAPLEPLAPGRAGRRYPVVVRLVAPPAAPRPRRARPAELPVASASRLRCDESAARGSPAR